MAAHTKWTSVEDEILTATANRPAAEVNGRLEEAGFSPRSADEIKYRRSYLRRRAQLVLEGRDTLAAKAARVEYLKREIAATEQRLAEMREEFKQRREELLSDLS